MIDFNEPPKCNEKVVRLHDEAICEADRLLWQVMFEVIDGEVVSLITGRVMK
jgi:hypothetical protein